MNIQQVRYYIELCKYCSFTTAAEKLFISQQGLSMAILRLESEFGCRFFNRTSRGLVLTEQGKFFLEKAKVILREYEECESCFRNMEDQGQTFTLCASMGTLAEYGAMLIRRFNSENTGCTVRVVESYDYAVDEAVESGKAELAFGVEPFDTGRFDYLRLFSAPAMAVVADSHPLAHETILPDSCFHELPMVLVDERFKTSQDFLATLQKEGIRPEVKLRTGEILAVHRLASTGLMCGLTNHSIAATLNTPGTVLIPLENARFTWSSGIIRKKDAALSPAAEKFWELCSAAAEE